MPRQPVRLNSRSLQVVFDRTDGLPYQYRFQGGSIWGEDSGSRAAVTLCRLHPRAYKEVSLGPKSVQVNGQQADFWFEASYEGRAAASFHLKYDLKDASLVITLDGVVEHDGFELIEVSLPNLVTVREEDGFGWLAQGRGGGSMVDLKSARPGRVPDDPFFGRISTVLPVAMVGHERAACVMEVTAYSDGTEVEVSGVAGRRHARIGTVQMHRVHGGRSYEMNDGGPRIAGNESTPNLPVGQTPRCRLDFFGDVDGDGTVDWLDGAKVVRERMTPIPSHYFDDKFLYLIHGRYKPEPLPRTTFRQSEKLIRDVAMLTDFAPQVAFVSGWIYDGQDTGYPCEDKVNQSMGGYDDLKHLIALGPKYNANVTLNVNYDDAYKSCAQWSPAIIARRPDGQIWASREWAGEMSYITGLAKYMAGPGPNRVKYTVQRYGIHDAILVDALSWYAIRNDWDLDHPASGYKNLVEGRYKVIDEFLKYGVHVVSEMLRYPYVGKLVESGNGVSGGDASSGGEPVPMVPVIYRKSAIWGGSGADPRNVAQNLFWNSRPIYWYGNSTDRAEMTDFYYLSVLPWMKVHDKNVQTFHRTGYRSEVGLDSNSSIAIDWMTQDYKVVVDGVEVAADNATFCPLDGDRIAFYAREARQLDAPMPRNWDARAITARALFVDHREEVPVRVNEGEIRISVPAGRPIIVYRNATVANTHAAAGGSS